MLGKIAGAILGNRMAGRNDGVKGAILGAAGARIAARGLGPFGTALTLAWGAKKLYNWNKERKATPTYPRSAAPASRTQRTNSL